jgi:hypothetical protein
VSDTNFDGELLVVLVVDPQCYMGRLTARVTCSPPSVILVAHDLATVASQVDAGLGPALARGTKRDTCRPRRRTVAVPQSHQRRGGAPL